MAMRNGTWKAALGLGTGALGLLTAIKVQDDRRVDGLWRSLEQVESPAGFFTEEMVSGLPDPARRYFLHAIRPGTSIASKLRWRYSGSLKPAPRMPWMSLEADQIVVKERGFVWKARAWSGPLLLTAADHYLDGEGRMRISLYGLIPVINATGPDLSRSALGRLLIESVSIPSSLLPGPNMRIEGVDQSQFRATVTLRGDVTPITVTVDGAGRVKEMVLPRWGNLTEDGSYRYIPYGASALEERTFEGYTIPSRISVGWWFGTERYQEVVRLGVDWARLW